MAPKRAKFYSSGEDARCSEVRKFIEDSGVLLDVRDVIKDPLSKYELAGLIGHLNIEHFLNKFSEAYSKHKLDEELPSRDEVLDLIEKEPTLLRKPIVQSTRLLTVGCDKKRIAEMLQISGNGQQDIAQNDNKGNDRRSSSNSRKQGGKHGGKHGGRQPSVR